MNFLIKEIRGIAGYEILTYIIEANSEKEAIELLEEGNEECIDIDYNIKQSDFESRDITIKD